MNLDPLLAHWRHFLNAPARAAEARQTRPDGVGVGNPTRDRLLLSSVLLGIAVAILANLPDTLEALGRIAGLWS